MRRLVTLGLGLLELSIAVLLAAFAWQLPGQGEVTRAIDRLERVSHNAGRQVRNMEASLGRARGRQPELRVLAARLQAQMDAVNKAVHRRDFTGTGIWTIQPKGDTVHVIYDWRVRADKAILRYLSFLMKPIFAANHHWAMKMGERSMELELLRPRAVSPGERAQIPPPPPPTFKWAIKKG